MSRQSKRNKNTKSMVVKGAKSEILRSTGALFLYQLCVVTANPQANLRLSPTQLDSRMITLASLYRFYRFRRLAVTFRPNTLTDAGLVGFTSAGNLTSPTTAAQVLSMERTSMTLPECTVPSNLNLGVSDFNSIVPWFYTADTPDAELDTAGYLVFSSLTNGLAAATRLNVYLTYELEFKERLPDEMMLHRFKQLELSQLSDEKSNQDVVASVSTVPQSLSVKSSLRVATPRSQRGLGT
jgi:hypothetical protein